ncbi:unnamed protein product [Ranitomeya imitator]|uniref:Receptor ligand binding region domain-containing protein n=1 Tax=Ranitomeya imitator TaxID=111125 RepID=A0ABN9LFW7_9NEOB|nr:unnamed protein product [Ranitomeya imitator]
MTSFQQPITAMPVVTCLTCKTGCAHNSNDSPLAELNETGSLHYGNFRFRYPILQKYQNSVSEFRYYKYRPIPDICSIGMLNTSADASNANHPLPSFYKYVLAFIFAIDEINKNPYILPNVTLGYHVTDSCNNENKAIENLLQILSGPGDIVPNYYCPRNGKLVGVVSDQSSKTSLQIIEHLNVYGYTQGEYRAISAVVSHSSPAVVEPAQQRRRSQRLTQSDTVQRVTAAFPASAIVASTARGPPCRRNLLLVNGGTIWRYKLALLLHRVAMKEKHCALLDFTGAQANYRADSDQLRCHKSSFIQ